MAWISREVLKKGYRIRSQKVLNLNVSFVIFYCYGNTKFITLNLFIIPFISFLYTKNYISRGLTICKIILHSYDLEWLSFTNRFYWEITNRGNILVFTLIFISSQMTLKCIKSVEIFHLVNIFIFNSKCSILNTIIFQKLFIYSFYINTL